MPLTGGFPFKPGFPAQSRPSPLTQGAIEAFSSTPLPPQAPSLAARPHAKPPPLTAGLSRHSRSAAPAHDFVTVTGDLEALSGAPRPHHGHIGEADLVGGGEDGHGGGSAGLCPHSLTAFGGGTSGQCIFSLVALSSVPAHPRTGKSRPGGNGRARRGRKGMEVAHGGRWVRGAGGWGN